MTTKDKTRFNARETAAKLAKRIFDETAAEHPDITPVEVGKHIRDRLRRSIARVQAKRKAKR